MSYRTCFLDIHFWSRFFPILYILNNTIIETKYRLLIFLNKLSTLGEFSTQIFFKTNPYSSDFIILCALQQFIKL